MHTRPALAFFTFFALLFILFPLLTAGSAPNEVYSLVTEAYIRAVADQDLGRLAQASCGSWEPNARHEAEVFAGVETRVEGLACSVERLADGTATVTCRGAIVASYETGDRYYPLAGRIFTLQREGGIWLVCGAGEVRPGTWGAGRTDRFITTNGWK